MKKSDLSKLHRITIRFNDTENELIEKEVRLREQPKAEVLRNVLMNGLAGYSQKEEYMLSRLDKLDSELALLKNIALLAASAATLPFAAEPEGADESEKLRAQLKKHFKDSNTLGKNLLKLIEGGKL
jgi:hypothetical protein